MGCTGSFFLKLFFLTTFNFGPGFWSSKAHKIERRREIYETNSNPTAQVNPKQFSSIINSVSPHSVSLADWYSTVAAAGLASFRLLFFLRVFNFLGCVLTCLSIPLIICECYCDVCDLKVDLKVNP